MDAYLWTVGSRNKSLRISDCCKATTKYKKRLGVRQITAVHKMRSSVLSRQSWWFRRQSLSKLTTSKEKKRKKEKRKEKKRKEKKRKEKKRKEKKRREEKKRKEKKRKEKKRKEKTTPFGVNLMGSQVLYRAAHLQANSDVVFCCHCGCTVSRQLGASQQCYKMMEGDMRLRDKMTLWANPASLQWTVGRADVINADKTTSVCHIQIHIPLRGFTKVASVAC